MVPEFTTDETVAGAEEVKEAPVQETEAEKETPSDLPAESETVVSDEKPAEPARAEVRDDSKGLEVQVRGLQDERVKLLKEIQDLRGQRREIKREELTKVDQKIDDLKDVNPEDISLIDKVLRSKGYLTKEESQKMFYESVKQEELNKFLDKYPEYKPENDPHDVNWNTLQRELGFYRLPDDPKRIGEVLLRAHRGIAKVPTDRTVEVRKQQVKTASVGSGGSAQRSSSQKTLDPEKRHMLLRGGWSEEEIKKIETRL